MKLALSLILPLLCIAATPAYVIVPQPDGTQQKYIPEPATQPAPPVVVTPPVVPENDPNILFVQPGQSWVAAVKLAKTGQTVRLAAGEWTEALTDTKIRLNGVRIEGAGREKTKIRVAKGSAIVAWCWDNVPIVGIHFTCDRSTATGISFWGCHGCSLLACQVDGFQFNVTAETASSGGSTRACANITIDGNRILNATPYRKADGSWSDSSGAYCDTTAGLQITGNLFDHNGWSEAPGGCPGTTRNHNLYLRADNSGAAVKNNIFARASSHGAQVRCGGEVRGNIFIDNPIHLSFGLVNGAGPIVVGGVGGVIDGNTFVGTRPLAGQPRGYAVEISNAKDVAVTNNIFAGDHRAAQPGPVVAAVKLDVCGLSADNKFKGKEITVARAVLSGNQCTWPGGLLWRNPKIPAANVMAQATVPAVDVAATRAAAGTIREAAR